MTTEVNNSQDVLDSRDVIARFEELETELQNAHPVDDDEGFQRWLDAVEDDDSHELQDMVMEFKALRLFLGEMCGNGGDEQWRGDWYPVTIVRDSYFTEYAQELAEDIGAVNRDMRWPYTCIDWEKAASELQQDYTSVNFDNIIYWVR